MVKLTMKEQTSEMQLLCPLRHVLDIIGGKWKLPILCILSDGGSKRYSQIKRRIPDITNTMLSQSLKELEADRMIIRRQYNEVPPRVEYALNSDLEGLIEPLILLGKWGAGHLEKAEKEPACGNCTSKKNE